MLITAIGSLAFTVASTGAVALWRSSRNWTRVNLALESLGEQIRNLVIVKDREHAQLSAELRRVSTAQAKHDRWHSEQAIRRRGG